MRKFQYQDPDGSYEITEEEIIKQYFPYWSCQMKKVGKADKITKERCIEDFIILHWAWEL